MGLGKTVQVFLLISCHLVLLNMLGTVGETYLFCLTGFNIPELVETFKQRSWSAFSCMPCFCFGELGKRDQKMVPSFVSCQISWCDADRVCQGVKLLVQNRETTTIWCTSCMLLHFWTPQVCFCFETLCLCLFIACFDNWYLCFSIQQKDDRKILKRWKWSCVLLDEAHALKDKNSYRWKNLMSLARNANQRLMLTGTPLQNDLHVCHWIPDWFYELLNVPLSVPRFFRNTWQYC